MKLNKMFVFAAEKEKKPMNTRSRVSFSNTASENPKSKPYTELRRSIHRKFNLLVGVLLLALCVPAEAQQPGKIYRLTANDLIPDRLR